MPLCTARTHSTRTLSRRGPQPPAGAGGARARRLNVRALCAGGERGAHLQPVLQGHAPHAAVGGCACHGRRRRVSQTAILLSRCAYQHLGQSLVNGGHGASIRWRLEAAGPAAVARAAAAASHQLPWPEHRDGAPRPNHNRGARRAGAGGIIFTGHIHSRGERRQLSTIKSEIVGEPTHRRARRWSSCSCRRPGRVRSAGGGCRRPGCGSRCCGRRCPGTRTAGRPWPGGSILTIA
jgi:hypothetical protein